jgi:hypothetical protein
MRPIAVIEVLKGFDLRPQLSQRGRQVADPVELIDRTKTWPRTIWPTP